MSDTMTRDDRRSALDAFAHSSPTDNAQALVAVTRGAPPEPVYGSREVSTKRDEAGVLQRIRVLAAAAGSSWYYRFPVKNKKLNRTDWIEGPSIELALDIARIYGNCHIDCRAEPLGSVILFHARFHDVESGFSLTRPFEQRRGASRLGGDDVGRRDEIGFSIGASKAIRNVVVNALKTYANFAFEEARDAIVEKIGRNIERWRTDTIEKMRVELPRVEAVIGRPAASWLAPDIAKIRAMGKAIEEGMATWDETFPPLGGKVQEAADAGQAALDKFADERQMVGAGEVASPGGADAAHESPENPSTAASATGDVRFEIIDKLIKLTTEPGTKQDRLEALDTAAVMLDDLYPASTDFLKLAITTTAKVINDKLSAVEARNYLKGIVK